MSELRKRFQENAKATGFVLDDAQFTALHHARHCNPQKRFVILAGLSGTGKTALVRHYARIYCEAMGLDAGRHLEVVAVSPDWKDPTGLLGYYNALHEVPSFQVEPTLRLLLAAVLNPSEPYFLLLDEMNLARVEQYFAPFLSSMESGLPLALHGQDSAVNGVPPRLEWPRNLFIAGTVNMDETTFPFSDKVLDRAFTLEFWDVDLGAFFAGAPRAVRRNWRRPSTPSTKPSDPFAGTSVIGPRESCWRSWKQQARRPRSKRRRACSIRAYSPRCFPACAVKPAWNCVPPSHHSVNSAPNSRSNGVKQS
ncbi:McrB family protein [Cystobacter fuscus]